MATRLLKSTSLVLDATGKAIDAISYRRLGLIHLDTSSASARIALPTGAEIIEVFNSAAADAAIDFGTVTVTASFTNNQATALLPAGGAAIYLIVPGETHIAAILRTAVTGKLSIAVRE